MMMAWGTRVKKASWKSGSDVHRSIKKEIFIVVGGAWASADAQAMATAGRKPAGIQGVYERENVYTSCSFY